MADTTHSIPVHGQVVGLQRESDRSLQQLADENLRERLELAFAAGRAQGLATQLESGRESLEAAALRLDAARDQAEQAMPLQVVELAVAIASELLAIEVRAGSYDLERLVRSALAQSGVGRGTCVVHVAPEDAERLAQVPFRAGTSVEADPALSPGDVQITTPRGLLVREMEPALDSIREQLLEELG